ncbi:MULTISPECIES: ATP-grasp domain-containing protein [unclassified Streptomyces]|uniref:ATP-grasp domain-containing protein n=1 Tax=unclassified Streptomyces TaxID=2593676 RepID=UPI00344C1018
MRNTVLVIGSGYQEFRQYVLEGLAHHCDVLLLNRGEVDWQRPFVTDHRVADLDDPEAVGAAVRDLVRGRTVTGVLTWEEKLVVLAATVGAELGVPTMPVEAARACRDKAVQRTVFAAQNVPSARFRLVSTAEDALRAASELGYPVVVKPRAQAASIGVQVVRSEADLHAAVMLAQDSEFSSVVDRQVLIEEFLVGEEISVDSWVLDGEVHPYVTALKRTGYPPFFEEVGHVAGPVLDPATQRAVRDVVERANLALGVDRSVTHTELMLTADGPKVIEVNGRLGGELIPYLAELSAPGLSAGEIAASVACGTAPRSVQPTDQLVGIQFLYPPRDLVLEGISVAGELADSAWLRTVRQVREPGAQLRLPPREFLGRAGFGIVTGEDVPTVDRRLAQVAAQVTVSGRPLR